MAKDGKIRVVNTLESRLELLSRQVGIYQVGYYLSIFSWNIQKLFSFKICLILQPFVELYGISYLSPFALVGYFAFTQGMCLGCMI